MPVATVSANVALHPAVAAWPETIRLLRTQRILFLPLAVAAGAKLLVLVVSLLAPFPPFSKVLAPFVRYFWGEIYLHYPYHLALANRWFRRCDIFLPILLEGFLIGATAYLCRQLMSGRSPKPRQAFSEAFRRFPAAAIIATISILALIVCIRFALILMRFGMRWLPTAWLHSSFAWVFIVALLSITIAAALESFLVFAIPSVVLENRSWFGATARSVRMALRSYGWIFLTILAVSLLYLPFILLRHGSTSLVTSAWPESILMVYLLRILGTWLFGVVVAVWGTVYLIRSGQIHQ